MVMETDMKIGAHLLLYSNRMQNKNNNQMYNCVVKLIYWLRARESNLSYERIVISNFPTPKKKLLVTAKKRRINYKTIIS